ncbi:hypothetical protein PFISCL1PPCAC_20707, partial [Pristionchus fissidentatus]
STSKTSLLLPLLLALAFVAVRHYNSLTVPDQIVMVAEEQLQKVAVKPHLQDDSSVLLGAPLRSEKNSADVAATVANKVNQTRCSCTCTYYPASNSTIVDCGYIITLYKH